MAPLGSTNGSDGAQSPTVSSGTKLELPRGLYVCPDCGGIRGRTWRSIRRPLRGRLASRCLCHGVACRQCGEGRVQPPGSYWYDPETSRWHYIEPPGWYRPGGMLPCAKCGGVPPVDYRQPSRARQRFTRYRVLIDDGRLRRRARVREWWVVRCRVRERWERSRSLVDSGVRRRWSRVKHRWAPYRVLVDDNFRYGREDERYQSGRFRKYEDALAKCEAIVEECLQEQFQPGATADGLYNAYMMLGEDPWISETPEGTQRFSAWKYARKRSREICEPDSSATLDDAP